MVLLHRTCLCFLLWHWIPFFINTCLLQTSITGFALHASEARCSEMLLPALICVSARTPPRRIGQLRWLMALTLGSWKPIHHAGEKKSGGGEENKGISVLHAFKKAIYHHRLTVGLPGGGGNQTHAKLVYEHGRGEMDDHGVTQAERSAALSRLWLRTKREFLIRFSHY